MDIQRSGSGCELRGTCGFFCDVLYLYQKHEIWKGLVRRYCEGTSFPLCARRIYFYQTGKCAPLDLSPLGKMPGELLLEMMERG